MSAGTERYGWPDIMRTTLAATYLGGSKWMVLRYVAAGKLTPAGKCGRSLTFRKADLDQLLIGETVTASNDSTVPTPRSVSNGAALDRIAAIAKAGAR